jgi:hypothetical protein
MGVQRPTVVRLTQSCGTSVTSLPQTHCCHLQAPVSPSSRGLFFHKLVTACRSAASTISSLAPSVALLRKSLRHATVKGVVAKNGPSSDCLAVRCNERLCRLTSRRYQRLVQRRPRPDWHPRTTPCPAVAVRVSLSTSSTCRRHCIGWFAPGEPAHDGEHGEIGRILRLRLVTVKR